MVSTHSHPKVAAVWIFALLIELACFNTQPPEGGCPALSALNNPSTLFQHTATRRWLRLSSLRVLRLWMSFQHTATRRWLLMRTLCGSDSIHVSTHSHPKVAAIKFTFSCHLCRVSTHSHPKVAAKVSAQAKIITIVSTHSHPKVAAPINDFINVVLPVSTHSHPKVAALNWMILELS